MVEGEGGGLEESVATVAGQVAEEEGGRRGEGGEDGGERDGVPGGEAEADRAERACRVDRHRSVTRFVPEEVPRAAAGVDEGCVVPLVDLLAEPAAIDLDQVGEGVVVVVPGMVCDLGAPDHTAGITGQVEEECVLLGAQVDGVPRAADLLSGGIDLYEVH